MTRDDDDVVQDGESVKVPLMLRDAVQRRFATFDARNYQPHHGELTDAQARMRRDARDSYVSRTCNAWRATSVVSTDTAALNAPRPQLGAAAATAKRAYAYDAMVQRLTNAWKIKTKPRDQFPHDDPQAAMRQHLGEPEPDDDDDEDDLDDLQAQRDAAYNNYVNNLTNAWRGPNRMTVGTGPSPLPVGYTSTGFVGAGPEDDR